MERTYVQSSAIHAIEYSVESRTLRVYFNDGRAYQYHNVPFLNYVAFKAAPSKGQYYNWQFHNGRFNGVRIN
jgi:hypothetical protein